MGLSEGERIQNFIWSFFRERLERKNGEKLRRKGRRKGRNQREKIKIVPCKFSKVILRLNNVLSSDIILFLGVFK